MIPELTRPTTSWRRVAVAVCAVGWGGNQFTPLLPMYRSDLGLSASTTQATFACYAVGLIPGLLLAGPAADRFGRRALLLPAAALSMLSGLVLVAGQFGVGWLFAGRLLAGVASGAAFSSGAAWLAELSPATPDAPTGLGARRTTVAMTVGFGLGPLVAGAIAQWAPLPGVLAYLPHLLLAAVAIGLLAGTDELRPIPGASTPRTPWAPELVRVVLPMAPWVFASASVSLAYLPGLLAPGLPGFSVILGAVATMLTAGAGIAVQPLARRLVVKPGGTRLLGAGLGLVTAGLLVAALTAATLIPLLVVPAAIVLGSGYGCCLVYGLREVRRLAPPARLGRMAAVFQALAYLGLMLPFPLAALQRVASPPTLLLAVAVLVFLTLLWTVHQARSAHHSRESGV